MSRTPLTAEQWLLIVWAVCAGIWLYVQCWGPR